MTGAAPAPVLEVDDLHVHIRTDEGVVRAVDGVSWSVRPGETLAIVGESGSGKSLTALAIMGLLPANAVVEKGSVRYDGTDLLGASRKTLRSLRGNRLSMIFQDPLSALNPVHKVGDQIAEVLRLHGGLGKVPARRKAIALLEEVGITDPPSWASQYPHQLSGGMRQRAMIAMALALNPDVLLADEPTTALDVTVQAEIMQLLTDLQHTRGTGLVLITHDLGLVAAHADQVLVMYAGRVAEVGSVDEVFYEPRHGYTSGLLASLPHLGPRAAHRLEPIPGQPPSLVDVPPGCAFHPRCRFAVDRCAAEAPSLSEPTSTGHRAVCHQTADVLAAQPAVRS